MWSPVQALRGQRVAAVAGREIARHAANRRQADGCLAMDLPVGHAAAQAFHYRPAVRHGLQLRRRAQVAQKGAAFLDAAQRGDGGEQVALRERFLPR
jgi:hypothetical protein